MKDEFEATFVVDLAPREVWEALTERRTRGQDEASDEVHLVVPGFPSLVPLDMPGASCTVVEMEAERLLRMKKDHHPCQGTEIAVRLEHADTGTRITIVQSGFGPFLDFAGRDTVFTHGHQIVRDLHLYLERRLTVPETIWGADLGALLEQTPIGLELLSLRANGFAETCGMRANDLLLTLRGVRIHDLQQLWTVLALSEIGSVAEVTWARGRETMSGKASFANTF